MRRPPAVQDEGFARLSRSVPLVRNNGLGIYSWLTGGQPRDKPVVPIIVQSNVIGAADRSTYKRSSSLS